MGSHSCKTTLLSWSAKFGLSMKDRALLGCHVASEDFSCLTYSRDELAQPMRALQQVLCAISGGSFDPDKTRSGRWVSGPGSPAQEAEVTEVTALSQVVSSSSSSSSPTTESEDEVGTEVQLGVSTLFIAIPG
eukprot:6472752-Amphidinium_carterae.1